MRITRNKIDDYFMELRQDLIMDGKSKNKDQLRNDLNVALYQIHKMCMQTKIDLLDVTSRQNALFEELTANGQLDLKSLENRRQRIKQKEADRIQNGAIVHVDNTSDKYKLENLPKIDCLSRIDLCKARCCRLVFALSFQDLDEGKLAWNYSQPYHIKHNEEGYCVHHGGNGGGCLVYENRPAVCRLYDCRNDKRIWVDYDKRIIAPEKMKINGDLTENNEKNSDK